MGGGPAYPPIHDNPWGVKKENKSVKGDKILDITKALSSDNVSFKIF